jgi:hypothetical protein
MAHVDTLRNDIIDKILSIHDEEYLQALLRIIEQGAAMGEKITFTEEQRLMLAMSENDLKHGRILSQEDLDRSDLAWLKKM